LRDFGRPAKRSLGQCFLVDPNILERIAAAARVEPGEHVLEIGPGPGTLTRTLLARGARVTAIELDDAAVSHLESALVHPRLELIRGDALEVDLLSLLGGPTDAEAAEGGPNSTKVVANLPYNVATEVFFRLDEAVAAGAPVSSMTLMFQREVARRFTAQPKSRAYGRLALFSAIRWQREIAFQLPPGAFLPRPRVHSALVHFRRRRSPRLEAGLEPSFRRLIARAFQKRRKTLRNALREWVRSSQFERAGVSSRLRAEALDFDGFAELARAVQTEASEAGKAG
jgi:16S rRNA (adenine1518-N6/adenine1519-N6)-dimethyltransferase